MYAGSKSTRYPPRAVWRQWLNRNCHSLIFVVLLVVIACFYGYNRTIKLPPKGGHVWRQTDCASIAYIYYINGMNPFKPQVFHQLGGNGYGISEFPVIYYFVAALYHIFGPYDLIFRLVNTLILFLGLFALFRLTTLFLKDVFWGYIGSLFLFTSPLIVFYGNGFISDVPALSFALVGLWRFFRYYENRKPSTFYWSVGFLLFAGLLKASAALSLHCVFGIVMIDLLAWYRFGGQGCSLFERLGWRAAASMALPLPQKLAG